MKFRFVRSIRGSILCETKRITGCKNSVQSEVDVAAQSRNNSRILASRLSFVSKCKRERECEI